MTLKEKNDYDPHDHERFHHSDPADVKSRLEGFYGFVARKQDELISKNIDGKKVLDIGSGYGFLLNFLQESGFDAQGIDPAPKEIEYSRKWWGVKVSEKSAYDTGFPDKHFDTVIMRDTIFHIDLPQLLPELKRICKKRVIIFMGNTGWLLNLAKSILRHKEHDIKTAKQYLAEFEKNSFYAQKIRYTDFVAFPLSGGYIGPRLVPGWKCLWKCIWAWERFTRFFFGLLGLRKAFAFRALLVMDLRGGE